MLAARRESPPDHSIGTARITVIAVTVAPAGSLAPALRTARFVDAPRAHRYILCDTAPLTESQHGAQERERSDPGGRQDRRRPQGAARPDRQDRSPHPGVAQQAG